MIGLDTNILVRYLVRDDKQQSDKVSHFIYGAVSDGETLFINCMVLCELVWVLESCYNFSKKVITDLLEKILMTKQFEFENRDIIRQCIHDYSNGKGDFADYLIGRMNKEYYCMHTVSLDRALKNNKHFILID